MTILTQEEAVRLRNTLEERPETRGLGEVIAEATARGDVIIVEGKKQKGPEQ